MIYKKCIMTIAKNGATLDEDIYLYRLDKNVELHFTIVNNKYKFDKSDMNNIISQTNAAYFQIRLYKNADIKYTFAIQPTDAGKAILKITDDLIDDPIEVGEYDFQISLLDEEKTSMISMPIVSKQLHVCEPLVSDDATMGKAILGLSKLATGEIKNAFDSDGNYIREIHKDGDILSASIINKFEEALDTNTKAIKSGTGTSYDDTAIKADINTIKTDLGTEELTTTAKDVKGAVNEVAAQYKDIKQQIANLGKGLDLSNLTLSTESVTDGTKLIMSDGVTTKSTVIPSVSKSTVESVIQEKIDDGSLSEIQAVIEDESIDVNKLDKQLQKVVKVIGIQDISWEIGKRDTGDKINNDNYCIMSSKIYFNINDTIKFISNDIAFKFTYWGTDGINYDSSKSSANVWIRESYTILNEGYYRLSFSFSPTSTTVVTADNLKTLINKFKIDTSYTSGLKGSAINDGSIEIEKFSNNLIKDNLKLTSMMKQTCIGGFGFNYGTADITNHGIVKKDNFYTLADMYKFCTTDSPSTITSWGAQVPVNGNASYLSDICIVGDELWCFATGVDNDKTQYSTVWRIKYDPINNVLDTPKFFWCNFGHINCCNYNPITDCIIMGNGSGDYDLNNKIFIMNNISKIKELDNGAIVDFANYGTEIDATAYDFGKKLNVFWANLNSKVYNYSGNKEYIPNIAYAYTNDVNKMYIIALGYGTYKYQYGTYVEPAGESIWNGTYNVLASYQIGDTDEAIGASTSYEHCGQGGDSLNGVAYIGLGHNEIWWTEINLGKNSFTKKDTWQPSINPETGNISKTTTRAIAISNDYLILAQNANIYYIPR